MDADEFVSVVLGGRRDFAGVELSGHDIYSALLKLRGSGTGKGGVVDADAGSDPQIASRASLKGLSLVGAMLDGARLVDVGLAKTDLTGASVKGADLRFARLPGSTLRKAQFQDADCTRAVLSSSDLSSADLTRTKLDGCSAHGTSFRDASLCETSAQGADFTNAKFEGSEILRADFRGARFQYTTFSDIQLEDTDLTDATFLNCRFRRVSIGGCDMSRAFFRECLFHSSTIERTAFVGATFISPTFDTCLLADLGFLDATLERGTFQGTKAESIDFENAKLHGIHFARSEFLSPRLSSTSISNLDLWPLIESGPRIGSASFIDYLSILRFLDFASAAPQSDSMTRALGFLRGCGLPDLAGARLHELLRSLHSDQLWSAMKSTFISYGGPDENFASRLNADLRRSGVKTFFFPLDAVFGEKLHLTMKRVNEYERIVLVCSKDSLERPGLQYELEKVLEREAREGGTSRLIPVALDGFLFDSWRPTRQALKEELLNRVVADFRSLDMYDEQFDRLLRALQAL